MIKEELGIYKQERKTHTYINLVQPKHSRLKTMQMRLRKLFLKYQNVFNSNYNSI